MTSYLRRRRPSPTSAKPLRRATDGSGIGVKVTERIPLAPVLSTLYDHPRTGSLSGLEETQIENCSRCDSALHCPLAIVGNEQLSYSVGGTVDTNREHAARFMDIFAVEGTRRTKPDFCGSGTRNRESAVSSNSDSSTSGERAPGDVDSPSAGARSDIGSGTPCYETTSADVDRTISTSCDVERVSANIHDAAENI